MSRMSAVQEYWAEAFQVACENAGLPVIDWHSDQLIAAAKSLERSDEDKEQAFYHPRGNRNYSPGPDYLGEIAKLKAIITDLERENKAWKGIVYE